MNTLPVNPEPGDVQSPLVVELQPVACASVLPSGQEATSNGSLEFTLPLEIEPVEKLET